MSQTARRLPGASSGSANKAPPTQNIAVMVDSFELAAGRQVNDKEDKLHGFLLHDVPEWGLKAVMVDGVPTTRVTVMATDKPEPGRRAIRELNDRKGAGDPVGVGGIAFFERSYMKDGVIYAARTFGGAAADELTPVEGKGPNDPGMPVRKQVFPDVTYMVRPSLYRNSDTGIYGEGKMQDVIVAYNKMAVPVNSVEEVESVLSSMAQESAANTLFGRPGVQLIARKNLEGLDGQALMEAAANYSNRQAASTWGRDRRVEDKNSGATSYVPLTHEEIMANLWRDNEGIKALIGNPEWTVEAIPLSVFNQAPMRLVSSQKANLRPGDTKRVQNHADRHAVYEGYEGDINADGFIKTTRGLEKAYEVDGMPNIIFDYGYRVGHVGVRLNKDMDGAYSMYQAQASRDGLIIPRENIETPAMADHYRIACQQDNERVSKAFNKADAIRNPRKERRQENTSSGPRP